MPTGAVDLPIRVSAMSSMLGYFPASMKSNTRRAIGAAACEPKPAFSTITASAMVGVSTGANATYIEWSR